LAAAATDGFIYTSADSGTTWVSHNVPAYDSAVWVASSADGTRLVAAANAGYIFTSTNSGTTWQSAGGPLSTFLYSVASSADGSKLVVGAYEFIFTSTNSGATWASNNVLNYEFWRSVASSADGNKLVAVASSTVVSSGGAGNIYISTNSGTAWAQADAPVRSWSGVASSADGCKLVGSAYPGRLLVYFGGIYTSQSTPEPQLNLKPASNHLAFSWIVPSTNFVLQQSSDLASWTDLTNTPILNLTNLQDKVVLSPTNSSGFYRLKTP
jgi:photosystem II stability/assembly factor-like uncharacterized protein